MITLIIEAYKILDNNNSLENNEKGGGLYAKSIILDFSLLYR